VEPEDLEATEGAAEPAAHPVLRRAGVWAEPEGLAAWVLMRLCWATVRRAALAEPEDWAVLAALAARAPIQPMAALAERAATPAWRATEPRESMGRMAQLFHAMEPPDKTAEPEATGELAG
jgi:hypothetical protein